MKKAFTMIELVFVIVILGIIASIAVPKLMAKKVDADVTTSVSETRKVIDEFVAYYILNGKFTSDMGDENFEIMSPTYKSLINGYDYKNRENKWSDCIWIATYNTSDTNKNARIYIRPKTTENAKANSEFCSAFRQTPMIKEWLTLSNSTEGGIIVGGSKVFSE